jgi:hypothetical protein
VCFKAISYIAVVDQVFGNMMCNFSSAFKAAYEGVGRNLTQMPPRADGRMNITAGHTAQALFVAVCSPHIPHSVIVVGLTHVAPRYRIPTIRWPTWTKPTRCATT